MLLHILFLVVFLARFAVWPLPFWLGRTCVVVSGIGVNILVVLIRGGVFLLVGTRGRIHSVMCAVRVSTDFASLMCVISI